MAPLGDTAGKGFQVLVLAGEGGSSLIRTTLKGYEITSSETALASVIRKHHMNTNWR
jgi:hypothetical protein